MPEPWFPSPLALTPPKEKIGKVELTAPLPTFTLELLKTDKLQMKLGLDKTNTSFENLKNVYKGMFAGEKSGESGTLGIKYTLNSVATKSPLEVLATKNGDCDEITRLAFLTASQYGVQNTVMVEMTWTNPKTKQFEGHSAIVLTSENPLDALLVFDFTYLHNGVPLDSANLETSLKKLYAEDVKNPDFNITQFGTVAEVEASYYDKVGWQYSTIGNWGMTALAYEKAVSLVPDSFEYNRDLAFAHKKLGKHEDSLKYYKIASETIEGKRNTEIFANIGELCLTLREYDEAIGYFQKSLTLKPDIQLERTINRSLASAYTEKGIMELNQGTDQKALEFFRDALSYDRTNEIVIDNIRILEKKMTK